MRSDRASIKASPNICAGQEVSRLPSYCVLYRTRGAEHASRGRLDSTVGSPGIAVRAPDLCCDVGRPRILLEHVEIEFALTVNDVVELKVGRRDGRWHRNHPAAIRTSLGAIRRHVGARSRIANVELDVAPAQLASALRAIVDQKIGRAGVSERETVDCRAVIVERALRRADAVLREQVGELRSGETPAMRRTRGSSGASSGVLIVAVWRHERDAAARAARSAGVRRLHTAPALIVSARPVAELQHCAGFAMRRARQRAARFARVGSSGADERSTSGLSDRIGLAAHRQSRDIASDHHVGGRHCADCRPIPELASCVCACGHAQATSGGLARCVCRRWRAAGEASAASDFDVFASDGLPCRRPGPVFGAVSHGLIPRADGPNWHAHDPAHRARERRFARLGPGDHRQGYHRLVAASAGYAD